MRLNRFFGNFDFSGKSVVIKDAETCHQICTVLRMQEGSRIMLCDGAGSEALVQIADARQGSVSCNILEQRANTAEPECAVTLYCAILKRENFELVAQKATEAGIKRLVPVLTMRTVKQDLREDRIGRIMREAAEQSGRGIVPVLANVMTLQQACEDMQDNGWNCVFDLEAEVPLKKAGGIPGRCGIFIGPEGGFDGGEVALLREAGCHALSLGSLTLRAETAAIIASYMIVRA